MSSKSHKLYTHYVEVYEETNASRYTYGKFEGFDVEVMVEFPCINEITFEDGCLKVSIRNCPELGGDIVIHGSCIYDLSIDSEGIIFSLKAGMYGTTKFLNQLKNQPK